MQARNFRTLGPGMRVNAARLTVALTALAALAAAGCAPSVRWRIDSFERAHAESRQTNQLTFVYFRNWYSVDCTDFEENVLKQPTVLEALRELLCVPLDFEWDRPLADNWAIDRVPAFVIVDPDGRLLARGEGEITVETLLQAIQQARDAFAPATRPAEPP